MQLTVLYDSTCAFCVHCARWLSEQEQLVPLELVPRNAPQVQELFPGLTFAEDELVVVDDSGGVYRDTDAFIMCLWALDAHRGLAMRASLGPLAPMARSMLRVLSSGRSTFSAILSWAGDDAIRARIEQDAWALQKQGLLAPDVC